ncbi:MAG TPA: NAD-dependent dihydropyrimidine dehydrogenase subunit PreA [Bacteroidetes bacterium]|nr:NAD-dependent dihydropyrimidine dehydrogenase subunit PreA [Bacteroidota bacterium]
MNFNNEEREIILTRYDDMNQRQIPLYPLRDLSVEFCGLQLENPFLLSAAPSTDELSMAARGLEAGWAGLILKTTSMPGTKVDLAYPMISGLDWEDKRLLGMGNIDLISRYHIDEVTERVRILKKQFPTKLIGASIMGSKKEDWQTLVSRLENAGVDLIECSFSCPQGNIGEDPGKMLAQSEHAAEITARWVKEAGNKVPVLIKITPQVTDIVKIAAAIKRAGADGITASNSMPALMGVDIHSFAPMPNLDGQSTYSGLTGPAIKPITLRTIAEIAKNVDIPISGNGGASNWRDAVEFMAVGAENVQICTAVMHYGFRIIDDLTSGLSHYLAEMEFASVREIIGKALPNIVDHDSLRRKDVKCRIHIDSCIGCELCFVACRDGGHEAIELRDASRIPLLREEKCEGCGLCKQVCPVDGCIEIR